LENAAGFGGIFFAEFFWALSGKFFLLNLG